AEAGAVGHDRDVARDRHDEAAALAHAVDRHEHDLRAALELHERRQVEAVGLAIERLPALVTAAHLAADAEVVARSGENEHVDVGIALGEHGRLLDAVVHLDGARVAALGPIEHDAEHAVRFRRAKTRRAEIDRRHPVVLAAEATAAPARALTSATMP